ncbi:MAG: hypothetical protein LBI01_04685, partial [Elusimicrobium sp.]|nr:hypothetical protein [Elusimicrobium sp.]
RLAPAKPKGKNREARPAGVFRQENDRREIPYGAFVSASLRRTRRGKFYNSDHAFALEIS